MPALDVLLSEMANLRAIQSGFLIIATISVALRMYVRIGVIHSFGWDDGFMLLCWVRPSKEGVARSPLANARH